MARKRLLLFALAAAAVVGRSSVARAQTIAVSGQPYPNRILPDGTNLGYSTRPQNLDPLGISYDDCIQDQTLQFVLVLTGFTGSDEVEVWASLSSDCTATTDRGIGATAAVCWGLPGPGGGNYITDLVSNGNSTYTFNVRVQDLVGWQVTPPIPSQALNPPAQGVAACHAQPTFAAVQMNINFLAINGDEQSDGTPYTYPITTDLVGPPSPVGVGETVGNTLFNVTWTANTDSDTAGYDIFMDPIPGQEGAEASGVVESGARTLVCPDASTTASIDGASIDGAETGGTTDAATQASITDATSGPCYYVSSGSSSQGSAGAHCNDSILQGALTQDAGDAEVTTAAVYDDAGNLVSEGGTEEGNGGISTIPAQYLVGVSSNTGLTISDKSVGQYQITGLQDYTWYNAVVAAVDGTGNVGPASAQVCDYPAPVQDFWQTYRQDGGSASGFCALETVGRGGTSLAGIVAAIAVAGIARRRHRNGQRT